jgi:hypothetical protein
MKKIILLLFVFGVFKAEAQRPNLDTVPNQSLTATYLQWLWIKGKTERGSDSLSEDAVKKIEAVFTANPGKTNATSLTVNNIPAKTILKWYRIERIN